MNSRGSIPTNVTLLPGIVPRHLAINLLVDVARDPWWRYTSSRAPAMSTVDSLATWTAPDLKSSIGRMVRHDAFSAFSAGLARPV